MCASSRPWGAQRQRERSACKLYVTKMYRCGGGERKAVSMDMCYGDDAVAADGDDAGCRYS